MPPSNMGRSGGLSESCWMVALPSPRVPHRGQAGVVKERRKNICVRYANTLFQDQPSPRVGIGITFWGGERIGGIRRAEKSQGVIKALVVIERHQLSTREGELGHELVATAERERVRRIVHDRAGIHGERRRPIQDV